MDYLRPRLLVLGLLLAPVALVGAPRMTASGLRGSTSSVSGDSGSASTLASLEGELELGEQQAHAAKDIPGFASPSWGGRTFEESPMAYNPWAVKPNIPMVKDLFPTAPFDRADKTYSQSITGAEAVSPSRSAYDRGEGYQAGMKPDYLAPYTEPRGFPKERGAASDTDAAITPLTDENIIHKSDRLRAPYGQSIRNPLSEYPLSAPADRIPGGGKWPIASEDKIPNEVGRFVDQVFDKAKALNDLNTTKTWFEATDANKDNAISPEEYTMEVEERQGKTAAQASTLWNTYHQSEEAVMDRAEFQRLASTGFFVGQVNRSDISGELEPTGKIDRGFWGSGMACPSGEYASGAQIKVMPTSITADNSGINAVKFKCGGGSEISTVEGPDGEWSDLGECPGEQRIYGIRARTKGFQEGVDNSGHNDLELYCRSHDLVSATTLHFGPAPPRPAPSTIYANDTPAIEGGWSTRLNCRDGEAICGLQARARFEDQGDGDKMGLTDMRFYCCPVQIDCTAACADQSSDNPAAACVFCREASGTQNAATH